MAELLKSLTDDQVALLGCLGALIGAMLMLSLSYHAGAGKSKEKNDSLRLREDQEEDRRPHRQAA